MPFVFNGRSSPDWLTVGFLSFISVFAVTFSECTSVINIFFISNSDVDVMVTNVFSAFLYGFLNGLNSSSTN